MNLMEYISHWWLLAAFVHCADRDRDHYARVDDDLVRSGKSGGIFAILIPCAFTDTNYRISGGVCDPVRTYKTDCHEIF